MPRWNVAAATSAVAALRGQAAVSGGVARLADHLRHPLIRNGYALVLSVGTTSVLGLVYWTLAARAYPPATVGLNSALIAAMMLLSGVAQLNLTGALIRFIPRAGAATARLIGGAYLLTTLVALAASALFLVGLDLWSPALKVLQRQPGFAVWFTVATMAWGIFALQDNVLTGLRQAIWVPIENTIFALAKIALLVAFARGFLGLGIFASWTIPVVLSLLPINALIFRRLLPGHMRATGADPEVIAPAQLVRYIAADYLGSLCLLASTTLLPLIVISRLGASANAYFSLAWTIAYTLHFVAPYLAMSLTVEATTDTAMLGTYVRRTLRQALALLVPGTGLMVLGAPLLLRLFGQDYTAEGATLLRLLACAALPNSINALYISVARVQRRMGGVLVMQAVLCALVLALSLLLLGRFGIDGVGIAWFVGQTVVASVLLAAPLRPFLWQRSDGRGGG